MLWFHLATFLNQRLKLLNNGIRSLRQWCSRAISLRSPQMRLWLPRETACRGFLGLNPKPTIADFSVCLQDYLDQLACIRSFWGVCVCVCVCVCVRVRAHSVMSDSLQPCGPKPARLLCPWASPGKNTGVGCHVLLQRIFPTRGWNCVSCIGSLVLYHRATWEAPKASEERVKIQSAGPQAWASVVWGKAQESAF